MDKPYSDAWLRFRKVDRLSWGLFIGYLPALAIIGWTLDWLFSSEWPFAVVAITWFIALGVVDRKASSFKCPRCGKYFFSRRFYFNGFTKKCLNCGLPKWAESDPSTQ